MVALHSLLFNTSFSFKDVSRPGFQLHSSEMEEESLQSSSCPWFCCARRVVEVLGGSKVAQGTFGGSLAQKCHVPSAESCHLRDSRLLSSNVSKVGTGLQLEDSLLQEMWGS